MSPTQVETVRGPVSSHSLGITLCHEHLVLENDRSWRGLQHSEARLYAQRPVRSEDLWRLREDPYLSLDNVRLDDEAVTVSELEPLKAAGGETILDPTCRGMGQDPLALRRISEASGITVVAGCGWYLERTHPPEVEMSSVEQLADVIVHDVREGIDDTGIRAGFIGEIGVSPQFTPNEEKVLRAAAQAQAATGVPLSIHLPGWLRFGPRVLDVVEREGANLHATIMCHMNPSHEDLVYQASLANRGAWLEYDMLGMDYYYPGEGQSPSDEQAARAIRRLIDAGFGDRVLLSSDVFLKIMLRRHGGFGYAHTLTSFAPRLRRAQVSEEGIDRLLRANPRALFEAAARDGG